MRIHGSIVPFTQQGLEKHNDVMTKVYFRASSHRGLQALRQIIEKRNQIEYFMDDTKRPKKHDMTSSVLTVMNQVIIGLHAANRANYVESHLHHTSP